MKLAEKYSTEADRIGRAAGMDNPIVDPQRLRRHVLPHGPDPRPEQHRDLLQHRHAPAADRRERGGGGLPDAGAGAGAVGQEQRQPVSRAGPVAGGGEAGGGRLRRLAQGLAKSPYAAKIWEDMAITYSNQQKWVEAGTAAATALLLEARGRPQVGSEQDRERGFEERTRGRSKCAGREDDCQGDRRRARQAAGRLERRPQAAEGVGHARVRSADEDDGRRPDPGGGENHLDRSNAAARSPRAVHGERDAAGGGGQADPAQEGPHHLDAQDRHDGRRHDRRWRHDARGRHAGRPRRLGRQRQRDRQGPRGCRHRQEARPHRHVGDATAIAIAAKGAVDVVFSTDGAFAFILQKDGVLRKMALDTFTEEKQLDIASPCTALAHAKNGLVVAVSGTQEVWLLSEDLACRSGRLPGIKYLVASPQLPYAYASSGGFSLFIVDLVKGKVQEKTSKEFEEEQGTERPVHVGFWHIAIAPAGNYLFAEGANTGLMRMKIKGDDVIFDAGSPVQAGNPHRVDVSGDSRYVAVWPAVGITSRGCRQQLPTYVFGVQNLDKPVTVIESGAYPQALGFDAVARSIYAQNHEKSLIVFSGAGLKGKEYDVTVAGGDVHKFVVHPEGKKLFILSERQLCWVNSREFHPFSLQSPF